MKAKKLIQTLALGIAALVPSWACAQLHPLEGWQPGDHLLIPIIQYRIADFYANKKLMGLNLYNIQGEVMTPNQGGDNLKFDYVPGLVAKAIIEAAQVNSKSGFAKSWFYSVEDYANRCAQSVPTTGKSLDDLNATKMYFTLYDLNGTRHPGPEGREGALLHPRLAEQGMCRRLVAQGGLSEPDVV